MIAKRWKTPALLGAAGSLVLLAGCSQTTQSLALHDKTDTSPSKTYTYRYTEKDRECLQRAIFFEANRSSRDGMIGVGTVVMNRLKSGKHGDTICQVVGAPRQFAPGVLSRKMNSKALPDVVEAADAVLKGERHPKMKNAMFFHTAGLKFKYNNMHYVAVAGGNAFYEKRGRNFEPLPPDSEFRVAAASPAAAVPPVTTKLPSAPAIAKEKPEAAPVMVAAAAPAPQPAAKPDTDVITTASVSDTAQQQPVMAFEQTPQDTSAIGSLIVSQARPMPEY
ncbi:cell wall hydrolase [Aquamicrobium terrae]|uniref:Spore germination cell wall hydrolase CwlJ-like protein n=1 Tax=Aquamicrobium terrae TaxID=1324945 RepID=A0ABV2MYZ9_9HYPH